MPRLTYAARSGAGSTATLRFKRGMRSWRTVIVKRARWAFILVGGIPIAIEIGRANHHALDWALGLTTGGTMALWLVLADSLHHPAGAHPQHEVRGIPDAATTRSSPDLRRRRPAPRKTGR